MTGKTSRFPCRMSLPLKSLIISSSDYECMANEAMHVTKNVRSEQNVLIIQPYIKWGPKKSATTPDLKLQESIDLIRSLDTWSIQESVKVGLESFDKVSLFGRGKLDELKEISKRYNQNTDKKVRYLAIDSRVLISIFSLVDCILLTFSILYLVDFLHFRKQKRSDKGAEGEPGEIFFVTSDGSIFGGDSNTAIACDEP